MKVKSESEVAQSCPTLSAPWTAAHLAPLSVGFSRQEYWSGLPLPSPIYAYVHLIKTVSFTAIYKMELKILILIDNLKSGFLTFVLNLIYLSRKKTSKT